MGRNAQKRRSKKVKAALKGEGSVVDETDDVGARGPRAPEPPQAPLWLKQTVAADADSLAVTDDSLSATLVRIALRIAAASSLDEVARDVADIFGADAAVLVRVYPEEDRGSKVAGRFRRTEWERAVLLERLVTDDVVECARNGEAPVVIPDVARDGRVPANLGTKTRFGSLAVAWLGEPTTGWGYLCVARREVNGFQSADTELLTSVAASIGPDLVQAVALYRGLTDPLTGQLSRQALFLQLRREVERASRARLPFSLLLLDVDGLRTVNAEHGLAVGDAVLKACAERLADAFRTAELCGRLTGDKFLIALSANEDEAESAAMRLLKAAGEEPVAVGALRLPITLSAGLAEKRPDEDSLALLMRAEAGLSEAKRQGGARVGRGPSAAEGPLSAPLPEDADSGSEG